MIKRINSTSVEKVESMPPEFINYFVALAYDLNPFIKNDLCMVSVTPEEKPVRFNPSGKWSHGGSLIEKELISVDSICRGRWVAYVGSEDYFTNPTTVYGNSILSAAMKCIVYTKFGKTVDLDIFPIFADKDEEEKDNK